MITNDKISQEAAKIIIRIAHDNNLSVYDNYPFGNLNERQESIYLELLQRTMTIDDRTNNFTNRSVLLALPNTPEQSNQLEGLVSTYGVWLVEKLVITCNERTAYVTRAMLSDGVVKIVAVHANIIDVIYEQLRRLCFTGVFPNISDMLIPGGYSSLVFVDNSTDEYIQAIQKRVGSIIFHKNIHIASDDAVFRSFGIGNIMVGTFRDGIEEEEDISEPEIDTPPPRTLMSAYNLFRGLRHILADTHDSNDSHVPPPPFNRTRFITDMENMRSSIIGQVREAMRSSNENILETVADESFNEARERAVNMKAEGDHDVFIGTKTIPRTDDNTECQLCCCESHYVCGHEHCNYSLCKDCVCRLRKTTGKCPNCQGILMINEIINS